MLAAIAQCCIRAAPHRGRRHISHAIVPLCMSLYIHTTPNVTTSVPTELMYTLTCYCSYSPGTLASQPAKENIATISRPKPNQAVGTRGVALLRGGTPAPHRSPKHGLPPDHPGPRPNPRAPSGPKPRISLLEPGLKTSLPKHTPKAVVALRRTARPGRAPLCSAPYPDERPPDRKRHAKHSPECRRPTDSSPLGPP